MQRLSQTLGKMFVVLVLLFGSPPPVSLQRLSRRPRVALVARAERRDTDPLALGEAGKSPLAPGRGAQPPALWLGPAPRGAEPDQGTFYPVRAA